MAIVTYRTVFNSSPKLAAADLLVLDDAHAGEQYVAEQYAVDVRRREVPGACDAILTALSPALDGMLVLRLRDPSPDPGAHQQVRLVVPLRQPGMAGALDAVLAQLPAPYCFRYGMIRGALPACLAHLSYPRPGEQQVLAGHRDQRADQRRPGRRPSGPAGVRARRQHGDRRRVSARAFGPDPGWPAPPGRRAGRAERVYPVP